MLEILAVGYNDIPPVLPVSGILPPEGGSVGREDDNDVLLPDPQRMVSRRHLEFTPEAGGYRLSNISTSNPAYINGETLEPGMSCMVQDNDKIQVGCYTLQIREVGERPARPATPAAPAVPDPVVEVVPMEPSSAEDASGGELIADDFMDDMIGDLPPMAPLSPLTPPPPANAPGPDPFAEDRSRASRADPIDALRDGGLELADFSGRRDGLINGADPLDPVIDLTHDPLANRGNGMLDDRSLDPLALFGDGGTGTIDFGLGSPNAEVHRLDHGAELDTLFRLPSERAPAASILDDIAANAVPVTDLHEPSAAPPISRPPGPLPVTADVPAPAPAQPPRRAFTPIPRPVEPSPEPAQVQSPRREFSPIPRPAVPSPEAPPAPIQPAPSPPEPPPANAAVPPPPAQAPLPSDDAAPVRDDATQEALYRAFLDGLGIDALPDRRGLDPEFMRLAGQILRCCAQGTVDLIAARAAVKREVKANVTLIAPERNNPLKFSPDGEVALMHLLGKPYPGFMRPVEALTHAYADLRSHQLGVIEGMRSALSHVLERFDPDVIDREAVRAGLVDSLLSIGRKARLWEAYGRYFQSTREHAEDRFQDFFGDAFLDAYEEATGEPRPRNRLRIGGRD